ncbi:hypothetical protein [Filimonas effusa]|uniref:Transglutaminase domain-containing protein n=1 Tax=Filimonas effusa TaxID=2508721 RepID=A0A4Q1D5C8_9BACT|nr:hypothetical protein [Filimonas effusa]RXK83649.1 hypothetical protein ESB13_16335 [Filimonas effusa]
MSSTPEVRYSRLSESEIETEMGRRFRRVVIEKSIPRLTYLYGRLRGKFWAEMDEYTGASDLFVKRYQFHIYEVTFWVNKDDGISKGIPFGFEPDANFPMHKLPPTIPCHLVIEGSTQYFGVVLHDPQFADVTFNHKLQQEEGRELFGTIETYATGYILDELKEVYEEIEYLPEEMSHVTPSVMPQGIAVDNERYAQAAASQGLVAGNSHKWWVMNGAVRSVHSNSIYNGFEGVISWVILALFMLALLPRLILFLPFIGVILVFRMMPVIIWKWLMIAMIVLVPLFFIISLLFPGYRVRSVVKPQAINYDSVTGVIPPSPRLAETDQASESQRDSLIRHYRKWYDYKGKLYEGSYYIKVSDYSSAHKWKNSIAVTGSGEGAYDYMLYLLKRHDQNRLSGLYEMFDSIKMANKLDSVQFADVIVSFVQQIPYCLVLEKACSPSLYSDAFIRDYLSSENARCDEYERFGINSPVEFMATSKGDCDTRTLFLYVIFRHYNYKVAVLSSEFYSHSLLGIHLPLTGQAYYYKNEPYYCWETTSAGIPAGAIPKEVDKLDYWRLSLTSD